MADDPPTLTRSSVSNHKSQAVTVKRVTATHRSKIVTRPRTLSSLVPRPSANCHAAWAKDEPPSPTDSHHEPSSPGGSYGPPDVHQSDVSQKSSAGPSGEHRWFPFTRRRPMLPPSEAFGAGPSLTRLERRPTISLGFPHRDDRSLAPGEKSPEQASPPTLDRGYRIALPTTPATPYTLPQTRIPGWDTPWAAARPLESFSHRNIYEQLQNGESAEEQPVEDATATNVNWWPRARKRARSYLLNNTYVPLVKHTPIADFITRVHTDNNSASCFDLSISYLPQPPLLSQFGYERSKRTAIPKVPLVAHRT